MFLSKLSHFIACFLSSENQIEEKRHSIVKREKALRKNPLQVSVQECTKVGFQGGQNTNMEAKSMKMGFLFLYRGFLDMRNKIPNFDYIKLQLNLRINTFINYSNCFSHSIQIHTISNYFNFLMLLYDTVTFPYNSNLSKHLYKTIYHILNIIVATLEVV